MKIENYSRVKLLSDFYSAEGIKSGAIGYVIEAYPDSKYEVEFSDKNGFTIAQVVLGGDEIELVEEKV